VTRPARVAHVPAHLQEFNPIGQPSWQKQKPSEQARVTKAEPSWESLCDRNGNQLGQPTLQE
jgi:hypothetical protein